MGTAASVVDPLEVGSARHAEGVRRLVDSFHAVPRGNRYGCQVTSTLPAAPSSSFSPVSTPPASRVSPSIGRPHRGRGACAIYEDLVDATLAHGLPYVVPQLKTITLGGAVTGLGIESTSFRLGLPHESVLEMDVLTGTGEIVTARPDGTERERTLFRGFPNSYGSLGYAVRLRIALEPVRRYVELRHVRFNSIAALTAALERISEEGRYDDDDTAGRPADTGGAGTGPDSDRGTVDFLDGVVFSADESYLTLGRRTDEPGPVSDYSGVADKQAIYYRSLQHDGPEGSVKRDRLTIRDYLWRWDTDWFWCSRAFGVQNPRIRRFWPQQLLRSSAYWKIIGLDHRYDLGNKIGALKGEGPRERVVQDVEVTIDRTAEFLEWFLREVPIEPVWLAPCGCASPRARDRTARGPCTRWNRNHVRQHRFLVSAYRPGMAEGAGTGASGGGLPARRAQVAVLGVSIRERVRPALWRRARGAAQDGVRPGGRFATLYDKAVGR